MKQKIKQFENTITQMKSDQITVEVVYLWLKLFLKSTLTFCLLEKMNKYLLMFTKHYKWKNPILIIVTRLST
jgi:hypothetical protein